jgi:hypothetical protein
VASDVVEVFAYVPFNIANALTVSTVDAKGDLLVGTGADTVGRLAVGTNGQLLAADSSTGSGLKWANPGLTLLTTQSFTSVASVNVNDVFSAAYDNYRIFVTSGVSTNADRVITLRLRVGGADDTGTAYRLQSNGINASGTAVNSVSTSTTSFVLQTNCYYNDFLFSAALDIANPFASTFTNLTGQSVGGNNTVNFGLNVNANFISTTSFTGFTLLNSAGNFTSGKVSVFGYNK